MPIRAPSAARSVLFTSPAFLVFFVLVFFLARLSRGVRSRNAVLLVASYVFYAAWNPPFVLLLFFSTALDWSIARRMSVSKDSSRRRAWLILSLVANLGLLGAFKYGDFLRQSYVDLLGGFGITVHLEPFSLVLPVGISFYTFQTLSYTIDVYRRTLTPTKSLLDYALFVSFFPQLVAGPIVRAKELLPQLRESSRASAEDVSRGALLFVLGLFKKVVLGDGVFAPLANQGFQPGLSLQAVDAWISTYAFAGQIYCDFSGYSDMAIGVALALGFRLPKNFDAPYGAVGFSDFWRRWHLSLSSWLRDYLYIPLGGGRRSSSRVAVNLAVTMLLGGLWHGAAWTFVVWGGLHALFLIGERIARRWISIPVPTMLARLATFHAVCVTWVFFRAPTLGDAVTHLQGMVTGPGVLTFGRFEAMLGMLCLALLLVSHAWRLGAPSSFLHARVPRWVPVLSFGFMIFLVLSVGGESHDFIYFRF